MFKKKAVFSLILILGLSISCFSYAQEEADIHFFYSALCPHCAQEKDFLEDLKEKYPDLRVKEYELVYDSENRKILEDFFEKYNVPERERKWVPLTFTPERYFIGFSDDIAKNIESCLKECLYNGEASSEINIPFLGEIDPEKMSLPVLSVVLGLLDGFNPCAMWVLLFLISLLLNTRSKKRMLLVGGTFILASGLVYYFFLTLWLNLFLAFSYINITRMVVGAFALA